MSLVTRARRAATLARDGLEVVREAQATSRTAAAPGADDAGALLRRDRAEAVAGVALAGPEPVRSDDMDGVRYRGGGWELSLAAFHAAGDDDGPFDAARMWWSFVQPVLADEADLVPDLGRAALAHGDAVYVLAPPQLLVATAQAPAGADARAAAVAVLRDALSSA